MYEAEKCNGLQREGGRFKATNLEERANDAVGKGNAERMGCALHPSAGSTDAGVVYERW